MVNITLTYWAGSYWAGSYWTDSYWWEKYIQYLGEIFEFNLNINSEYSVESKILQNISFDSAIQTALAVEEEL